MHLTNNFKAEDHLVSFKYYFSQYLPVFLNYQLKYIIENEYFKTFLVFSLHLSPAELDIFVYIETFS